MIRRFLVTSFAIALFATAGGCSSSALRDVHTVHNLDASRIWVIRRVEGGGPAQEHIVYCDRELAVANRPLCLEYHGQ